MNIFLWLLFIIGGFISGSVMYCKIIPKLLLNKDICELSDDCNPGAFNAFAHCGKKVGILCLTLDILKGFVPVLLAGIFMETDDIMFAIVMLSPVLGHALGVFNRFQGGKCIAVSFGVLAGILPVTWIGFATLATLYIISSTIVKIKSHGIRTIIVYLLFALISCTALAVLGLTSVSVGCGWIALLPIIKCTLSIRRTKNESYGVCVKER